MKILVGILFSCWCFALLVIGAVDTYSSVKKNKAVRLLCDTMRAEYEEVNE